MLDDLITKVRAEIAVGQIPTQAQIDEMVTKWLGKVRLKDTKTEVFRVAKPDGTPTELTAPRWLVHLIGLPHRCAHVLLLTPKRLIAIQIRSWSKDNFPGCYDISVGGHVKGDLSFLEAAYQEMGEELGLSPSHLWDGTLDRIGVPFEHYDEDKEANFYNREVNQLFFGRLTEDGVGHLNFKDGEVAGLYLCYATEVDRILAQEPQRVATALADAWPKVRGIV